MDLHEFLERSGLQDLHRTPSGYQARCPAHDDHNPSLSISEGHDGRILVHCWAGCQTKDILTALGLSWTDLFLAPSRTRCRR